MPSNRTLIQTAYPSMEFNLLEKVVTQGVDSHNQTFRKSRFAPNNEPSFFRIYDFDFHNAELPILIRRLRELGANDLADDLTKEAN